jgi:hypothetical protein
MNITAYTINNPMTIDLPNKKRQWMDNTANSFAYRCLPLTVANGYGWSILNPSKFTAIWDGGMDINSVKINEPNKWNFVQSHFGSGIITFNLGFLFRTDEGINLYAKGPANNPKRGISALEGIIETDWLPYIFTMNWKITEPNYEVVFEKDEPICTFFPIKRGFLEEHNAEIRDISENLTLKEQMDKWGSHRTENAKKCLMNKTEDIGIRHYLRGENASGEKTKEHQVNIKAKPFNIVTPYTKPYTPWVTFAEQHRDSIPCYDECCPESYK